MPGGQRFDKFSERSRRVLTLAREEAQRFRHSYVGTEHLLLGLLREGDGVAAKVLLSLGVSRAQVRTTIEAATGPGDQVVAGEIGLTPQAKKVIELAVDESHRMGHGYIGTEHLLLGLIREGEGIGARILLDLGLNVERIRAETTRVLEKGGTQRPFVEPAFSASSDQLTQQLTEALEEMSTTKIEGETAAATRSGETLYQRSIEEAARDLRTALDYDDDVEAFLTDLSRVQIMHGQTHESWFAWNVLQQIIAEKHKEEEEKE